MVWGDPQLHVPMWAGGGAASSPRGQAHPPTPDRLPLSGLFILCRVERNRFSQELTAYNLRWVHPPPSHPSPRWGGQHGPAFRGGGGVAKSLLPWDYIPDGGCQPRPASAPSSANVTPLSLLLTGPFCRPGALLAPRPPSLLLLRPLPSTDLMRSSPSSSLTNHSVCIRPNLFSFILS